MERLITRVNRDQVVCQAEICHPENAAGEIREAASTIVDARQISESCGLEITEQSKTTLVAVCRELRTDPPCGRVIIETPILHQPVGKESQS